MNYIYISWKALNIVIREYNCLTIIFVNLIYIDLIDFDFIHMDLLFVDFIIHFYYYILILLYHILTIWDLLYYKTYRLSYIQLTQSINKSKSVIHIFLKSFLYTWNSNFDIIFIYYFVYISFVYYYLYFIF